MSADPESIKDTDDLTVCFTLSGSKSVKAVRRTLMKLSPYVGDEVFKSLKLYLES